MPVDSRSGALCVSENLSLQTAIGKPQGVEHLFLDGEGMDRPIWAVWTPSIM